MRERIRAWRSELGQALRWDRALTRAYALLAGVFALALSALVRADYLYKDDVGRALSGYRDWYKGSRYLSDGLSVLLHADTRLDDLSPLPQILAVLLLALACVIVVRLFAGEEAPRLRELLAVIPFALNPYFLQCLSFRFDAPYMAFSVLASVLPFWFLPEHRRLYGFFSVAGTLMMCLTYQSSSGIYPLVVMFYVFTMWNRGVWSFGESVWFAVRSALCYVGALVFYRVALVRHTAAYATAEMYSLRALPGGILRNYKKYYRHVRDEWKLQWLLVCAAVILVFYLVMVLRSRRNKLAAAALAAAVLAAGSALAFGVFLVLKKPLFMPRMMYGTGVLMALIALTSVRTARWRGSALPAIALSWCFFIFCFTYGNALGQQATFSQTRLNVLLSDLNDLEQMQNGTVKNLQFANNVGKAPAVKKAAEDCKVLNQLVPSILGSYTWARNYFYWYLDIPDLKWNRDEKLKDMELPVLKDTMYHTIQGDEEHILITFKRKDS